MYSMLLMASVAGSADSPAFGDRLKGLFHRGSSASCCGTVSYSCNGYTPTYSSCGYTPSYCCPTTSAPVYTPDCCGSASVSSYPMESSYPTATTDSCAGGYPMITGGMMPGTAMPMPQGGATMGQQGVEVEKTKIGGTDKPGVEVEKTKIGGTGEVQKVPAKLGEGSTPVPTPTPGVSGNPTPGIEKLPALGKPDGK